VGLTDAASEELKDAPIPLKVDTSALVAWKKELWAQVEVYGRYVSETEIDENPLFGRLAPKPEPIQEPGDGNLDEDVHAKWAEAVLGKDWRKERAVPAAPHRPAIYLLMLFQGRPGANRRINLAKGAVRIEYAGYTPFTIAPPGNLIRGDRAFLLVQVVDSRRGLSEDRFNEILRSPPEIIIEDCSNK
jgi:hypothetical protein